MKFIADFKTLQLNHTAVALGKFDGIHIGHALLLEHVKRLQDQGFTGVVFTFEMKPNRIFDINTLETIYTKQEKRTVMAETGIDYMIEYPFDDTFAAMPPEVFVEKILIECLDVKYVIVGEDFCFGHKRTGNVEMLRAYGEKFGFQVIAVEKKKYENRIVSSSYIRECISNGGLEEAAYMLNRNFCITGTVVEGRKLGRTIGVPTANLLPVKGKLYPPAGVYASRIHLPKENSFEDNIFYGITNIGDNPTIDEHNHITIETYIFDFDSDLYGKNICVELLEVIRMEKKFESVEALKEQIHEDIDFVKQKYLTR